MEQKILFYGVFWAPEKMCDWTVFGGKKRAEQLQKLGLVHFAGIASSIPVWDHNAQYQQGVQVAEKCLVQ